MKRYHSDIKPLYISEKYDGVRATWDGKSLKTRTGNPVSAPKFFTARLPAGRTLTGELWLGRGRFDAVRALVQTKTPADDGWKPVKFMVFEGARQDDDFDDLGPCRVVTQHLCEDAAAAEAYSSKIVQKGGEGAVIISEDGERYKLKPYQDDDGRVIRHITRGGVTRALVLALRDEREMTLSAGLSDDMRTNPPRIGSIITFTYQGRTSSGLPRFARFQGLRAETEIPFEAPTATERAVLEEWLERVRNGGGIRSGAVSGGG